MVRSIFNEMLRNIPE